MPSFTGFAEPRTATAGPLAEMTSLAKYQMSESKAWRGPQLEELQARKDDEKNIDSGKSRWPAKRLSLRKR